MAQLNLGDRVRDKVTGFTGIAVARCIYITGCDHIEIKPEQLHDGKTIKGHWFDITRLEILNVGAVKLRDEPTMFKKPTSKKRKASSKPRAPSRTGGPGDHPEFASETPDDGVTG